MYNSILLAADGSKNSIRAAQELLNFIGDYTIVTILTVVDIEESKTDVLHDHQGTCLLYTSPSPRDATLSRMPSSA